MNFLQEIQQSKTENGNNEQDPKETNLQILNFFEDFNVLLLFYWFFKLIIILKEKIC